jgi:hypothetical protein
MTEPRNSHQRLWQVDLAKSLAWPIFGLFLVLSFWSSLHKAADSVASVMINSEAITIGQLSIKISKRGGRPSPEVRLVLKEISSASITHLLEITGDLLYTRPQDQTSQGPDGQLIKLNLVQVLTADEVAARSQRIAGAKFNSGIFLTPLGVEVQRYLQVLTAELAQEVANADAVAGK